MTGDISNVLPLPDAAGIIPRVLHALFARLEADEIENSVKCSFIELYNEELRDLLSPDDATKLKIYDDNSKKGSTTTMVQGMEECHLKTASEGIKLLANGSHKRQVAATKCNDLSSRSHTVFTISVYVKRTTDDGQEFLTAGKLNLVDLAGSENIQRSGAENKRAAEAGLINKSLLTLGRVINALVERSSHIPYRESKLTRLLQDSLGGRTKTCIIATLSPAKSNLEETISTLDYAFRAKNIRNKPQVNQPINKKTLLKEYTMEIEKLKSELIATRQRNGVYLTQENYEEITTISESRRILSEEQRERLETMEVNLRTKVEDLFKLTTKFQTLKKDNEQTQLALDGTKGILEKTEIVLNHTRQNLDEETELRKAHQKTEQELVEVGRDMMSTLGKTTSAIDGLRSKIRRKSELQSQNRRNWNSSQTQVVDTTRLVEDRIEEFQHQQEQLMDAISERMQTFVRDELEKLGASQSFLQEKMEAYQTSETEVNGQTAQARDHMNEVLEEIKTLREEVKTKIGAGLDELSAAAETISANIITELDAFHTQVHASYASLGRDFKTTFDDLVKDLNEQQAENERLHQQVVEANTALIEANKASEGQLAKLVDEEKQKSAEDRQELLSQITALMTANASAQEKRLEERLSAVREEIAAANAAYEAKQDVYREGVNAWTEKSRDILAGVSKSRETVKTKIKSDFAVSAACQFYTTHANVEQAATEHSTSIKDTTTSVHESTVKTVEAQMAHLDTQLQSLDDIVSRIREQNNAHHAAHTTSLAALSSTVGASYSSIGDHLASSFDRVQSLESDMSAHTAGLKETLPSLSAEADIRAPLHELREAVSSQNLLEYKPTGETPQRVSYNIPSTLPRTEAHENIISRLRNRSTSVDTTTRSPSKQPIFNDATNSLSLASPTSLFSPTTTKLEFPLISAHAHTISHLPTGGGNPSSLRELDVNVVAQEAHTQPLPHLASQSSSDSLASGLPPNKKMRTNGEETSKLPTKKIRKTVGIAGERIDRENITNLGSSVGAGRKLRSHGGT
jgi:kinesin family protein 11